MLCYLTYVCMGVRYVMLCMYVRYVCTYAWYVMFLRMSRTHVCTVGRYVLYVCACMYVCDVCVYACYVCMYVSVCMYMYVRLYVLNVFVFKKVLCACYVMYVRHV